MLCDQIPIFLHVQAQFVEKNMSEDELKGIWSGKQKMLEIKYWIITKGNINHMYTLSWFLLHMLIVLI